MHSGQEQSGLETGHNSELFTWNRIAIIVGGGDHHLLLIVVALPPHAHQIKGTMSEPN